jgi:hypothetical protein
MKVTIDSVVKALKEVNLTPADTRKVIEKLNNEAAINKKDPHAGPKTKKQFVVLGQGLHPLNGAAWVLQIEEGANPKDVIQRIKNAAIEYNNSRKGKLLPVKTICETLENVGRRFYDTANPQEKTLVKTKNPTVIVDSDNKL